MLLPEDIGHRVYKLKQCSIHFKTAQITFIYIIFIIIYYYNPARKNEANQKE